MSAELKPSPAYGFFNEGLDIATPTSRELIQDNIAEGAAMCFGPKHMEQRYDFSQLSPQELTEIEEQVANNGHDRVSRCLHSDFKDPDIRVREAKALMVNLYFEYGGSWPKVFRDGRSVSRRTMAIYWRDELFKAHIAALDPIIEMEARGVVVDVFRDGQEEKNRLAAALQFLAMSDPMHWDKGVRKQVVANKGSLTNALFSRVISDEEFLTTFLKDRLNGLPDNMRDAIQKNLVEAPALPMFDEAPPDTIRAADPNKLRDPFGDYGDD